MRFRLVLVAGACVVGCARSESDFNSPDQRGTRALAEKSDDDDFKDANLKGDRTFSDKPGAELVALLRGHVVILKPSGVAFRIPQTWLDHYDSPPKYPTEAFLKFVKDPEEAARDYDPKSNLHFTRQELDQVRSPERDEWDGAFAKVVDDLLPFEKCIFHGGGEGWGRQGHLFSDLQMRVYLGTWDLVEIQKLVGERGLRAVRRMSNYPKFPDTQAGESPRVSWDRTKTAGWQVETLTFPMWFYDYGATAVVDFHARKYPETTVVFVFMYTEYPGSQKAEIQEVVHSFRMMKDLASGIPPC
jgi:hypothetical protein